MSVISFRQSFRVGQRVWAKEQHALRILQGVFEGRCLGLERDYLAADCFAHDE